MWVGAAHQGIMGVFVRDAPVVSVEGALVIVERGGPESREVSHLVLVEPPTGHDFLGCEEGDGLGSEGSCQMSCFGFRECGPLCAAPCLVWAWVAREGADDVEPHACHTRRR